MIRVTISTGKRYLLMRPREQSFTFLIVDSLPPAIFVSHVSLILYTAMYGRPPVVKVQIFEGHGCVSRAGFHGPRHEKNSHVAS